MSYKNQDSMKYIFVFISLFITLNTQAQSMNMDWVSDKNYNEKIHEKSPFGDDKSSIVVIEFWAKFNDQNSFKEYNKVKGITHYYRCDLSVNPELKKKYRIRMTPTILIFKDGILEESFRAGLDLECPVDLNELNGTIEDIKNASQF